MMDVLFPIALIVLTVALIAMSMAVKHLTKLIDEIKEKLEFHRKMLQYLDSCELDLRKRLVHLEEVLELKEYFDEEPLNEEENIND